MKDRDSETPQDIRTIWCLSDLFDHRLGHETKRTSRIEFKKIRKNSLGILLQGRRHEVLGCMPCLSRQALASPTDFHIVSGLPRTIIPRLGVLDVDSHSNMCPNDTLLLQAPMGSLGSRLAWVQCGHHSGL